MNWESNYLEHHGIKGMKWGVIRKKVNDAGNSYDQVNRGLKDLNKSRKNRKKNKALSKINTKKMTDDELRKAINRLDMERRYTELKQQEVNRGRDRTNEILSTIGTVVSIGVGVATAAASIGELINAVSAKKDGPIKKGTVKDGVMYLVKKK